MKWIIIFLIVLVGCTHIEQDSICIHERCFDVEVVTEQTDVMKGLMFREHLDKNAGMLFVFPTEDIYPFWMKNTLIPLDMIWVDSGFNVVHIERDAVPCEADPCKHYVPAAKALYVLEVNAGESEWIDVGDNVEFRFVDQ